MSTVFAISGFKGGIGKSTVATNLAARCAREGLATLLVETDGQGNASQAMRVKPHNAFYELMHGAEPESVIVSVPASFHGAGDLCLISAFNLQQEIESDPNTPMGVIQRFHELRQLADVIIVDTSPGNTEVHAGLYYAADYLIMPTLCDFLSTRSLATTFSHLNNAIAASQGTGYRVAQVLGIVPNKFQAREDVQQANNKKLHDDYEPTYKVYGFIRDLTAWRQASQLRHSIYEYEHHADKPRSVRIAAKELDPVFEDVWNATVAGGVK